MHHVVILSEHVPLDELVLYLYIGKVTFTVMRLC